MNHYEEPKSCLTILKILLTCFVFQYLNYMRSCFRAGLDLEQWDSVDVSDSDEIELLDLSHNSFSSLNLFPSLSSLKELRLVGNQLSSLNPRNTPIFESLEIIDLSFNRIKDFPILGTYPSLKTLVLTGNEIERLCDFQIFAVKGNSLENLYLGGNRISEVCQFFYLSSLRALKNISFQDGELSNPVCSLKGWGIGLLQVVSGLENLDGEAVTTEMKRLALFRPNALVEGTKNVEADGIPSLEITSLGYLELVGRISEISLFADRPPLPLVPASLPLEAVEDKLDLIIRSHQKREAVLHAKLEETINVLEHERRAAKQMSDEMKSLKDKLSTAEKHVSCYFTLFTFCNNLFSGRQRMLN